MSAAKSDAILERMMALHPKLIDMTLDRVWRLLEALDHPERKLPPVIHVAGTNGKGSTQAMIRAGLEATGARVHAYTSPHLVRFHERIRLAGTLISEDMLSAVLDECYEANGPSPITYFEITTVAALLAFSRVPAEYCLLEVGLGGRLDATNVIPDPKIAVITPVSLDHQQFLGDGIEEIAGEKAGIIKHQVPVVIGPQVDAALDVIEQRADALHAPILAHGQHWHANHERDRLVFQDESGLLDLPLPRLPGRHQIENAGAALAVLRYLNAGEAAYEAAMTDAVWPARMQRLTTGALVDLAPHTEMYLDGGHNPSAGAAMGDLLDRLPKRPTYLICGMLKTKDVGGFMAPLAGLVEGLLSVSIPGETATLTAEETRSAAASVGIPAKAMPSVQDAIREIVAASPNARIVICGSLYLAGHVLRENGTVIG